MCNLLHHDSKEIRKKGFGYKILVNFEYGLKSPFLNKSYILNTTEYWNENYHGDGFCFLSNKKEALKFFKQIKKSPLNTFNNLLEIYKIKYNRGLGKHYE